MALPEKRSLTLWEATAISQAYISDFLVHGCQVKNLLFSQEQKAPLVIRAFISAVVIW